MVKLLEITINNELKFDGHINKVCIKAQKNFTVIIRIRKYLDFNKVKYFTDLDLDTVL